MIPNVIHQIWIGPHPPPVALIESWRQAHPAWGHQLWAEQQLDELEWRGGCRHLYDRYVAQRCWHGAADVARVEILRHHGGVYLDTDMQCLHPLDGADFLRAEFWVSESPHQAGRPQNAAMGCTPGHWLIDAYSRALLGVRKLRPAWQRVGAMLLQPLMPPSSSRTAGDVWLVPSRAFHPHRANGSPNTAPYDGPVFAEHRFASTNRSREHARRHRNRRPEWS